MDDPYIILNDLVRINPKCDVQRCINESVENKIRLSHISNQSVQACSPVRSLFGTELR